MFRTMILKEKIFITYHMFFLFIRHTQGQKGLRVKGEQTYFFRGINGARIDLRKKGGLTLSSPDFPPKRVGKMGRKKSTLNGGWIWGQGKKVRGFEPHLCVTRMGENNTKILKSFKLLKSGHYQRYE